MGDVPVGSCGDYCCCTCMVLALWQILLLAFVWLWVSGRVVVVNLLFLDSSKTYSTFAIPDKTPR